jgi:16S rRNA A1518/A1519 N6-dimethyltransferase RsmA/KsgA/DIM1 with predicted DNA glycosylase/AP lyase activity
VGRKAFRPVPGVDSAAVIMEPVAGIPRRQVEATRTLTRAAFSRRRKQFGTILRTAPEYRLSADEATTVSRALGIDLSVRPETIGPEAFAELAWFLNELCRNRESG